MRRLLEIGLGVLIAFALTAIGSYLYTKIVLNHSLIDNFNFLYLNKLLGKIIAIGSLLIIPMVYLLLNRREYEITRGVIAGLIILVIISQFV